MRITLVLVLGADQSVMDLLQVQIRESGLVRHFRAWCLTSLFDDLVEINVAGSAD